MYIVGKATIVNDYQVLLESDEKINLERFAKLADGKVVSAGIEIHDQRLITEDQRNKFWALIRDFCDVTGYSDLEAESFFKGLYVKKTENREISTSHKKKNTASVEEANQLIQLVIDFMFQANIPFKTSHWDWIKGNYAVEINCLMNRECIVCGKQHADIAHYETVGMGRNRKTIDHRKYHFMALCRKHHIEQHKIGLLDFCDKHQIKPVKMTDEQLIKVGLMTKSRVLKFERLEDNKAV